MTKQQHTPGPWKAVYRHGAPDYHNIVDSRGIKIAEVFGETNGNGYLIEAAPEMLEALEALVTREEGIADRALDPSILDAWQYKKAVVAIKKAKGEIE